jgi:hypothetical protein
MMAGAAMMPEFYNKKVNGALLLAAAASVKNFKSEIVRLLSEPTLMKVMEGLLWDADILDLIPYHKLLSEAIVEICHTVHEALCLDIIGLDKEVDNIERLPNWLSYLPGGSGIYNFVHYGQLIHSKEPAFRRFDMGSK